MKMVPQPRNKPHVFGDVWCGAIQSAEEYIRTFAKLGMTDGASQPGFTASLSSAEPSRGKGAKVGHKCQVRTKQ
jgi:hypothetical protein